MHLKEMVLRAFVQLIQFRQLESITHLSLSTPQTEVKKSKAALGGE